MDKVEIIRRLIRPFCSVTLVIAAIVLTFTGKLDPQVVGTAFVAVISFHFGESSALKQPGKDDT